MQNTVHTSTGRARTRLRALTCAVAAALMAAGAAGAEGRVDAIVFDTPGEIPLLGPSYGREAAVRVRITDDAVIPRRVELEAGQTVAWVSWAREPSRITFEREVARSMVCHNLVNFYLEDDELRSAPLLPGDVAHFCELAPGVYRYRIERNAPIDRPTAGALSLSTRIEGVLAVRGPPSAAAGGAR